MLVMFPGQGSQFSGMARELVQEFPYCREYFERASEAISLNVLRLCSDEPDDVLAQTANTQPALLTVSTAVWHILLRETEWSPTLFAGHSLGEFSALVSSGKLNFERAVTLVRARGEAMQEAVPRGVGAMAAVIGADLEQLRDLCAQITSSKDAHKVEIANFNSPQQIVVAGHTEAVKQLVESLAEKKVRAVLLNVSAPFHSSLMKPARDRMRPLIEGSEFIENENRIIANINAEAHSHYSPEFLISQIDHPVQWLQSLQKAEQLGCRQYIEIGPGKVLVGLAKRTLQNKDSQLIPTMESQPSGCGKAIASAISQIQK